MLPYLVPRYLTGGSCCESPHFHFYTDATKGKLFSSQDNHSAKDFQRDLPREEIMNRLTNAGILCITERRT